MKVKLPLIWATIFICLTALTQTNDVRTSERKGELVEKKDPTADLGGALSDLAIERHQENTRLGRIWVLALQDSSAKTIKLSDAKYTFFGIPRFGPGEGPDFETFVNTYNSMNIRLADARSKAGRYKEAREIYNLLQHFWPEHYSEQIRQRLGLLDKIERGEDAQANLERLLTTEPTFKALSFLPDFDAEKGTQVPDLLKVDRRNL